MFRSAPEEQIEDDGNHEEEQREAEYNRYFKS